MTPAPRPFAEVPGEPPAAAGAVPVVSGPDPVAAPASAADDVVPFSFDGAPVRVITRDGEPWFVLADVCKVLGYSDSAQAARNLDADEIHTLHNTQGITESRNGIVKLINESGLYSLVLTSRKEAAKRFKKWVTAEVLPAIRKTGTYSIAPPAPSAPMTREQIMAQAHANDPNLR